VNSLSVVLISWTALLGGLASTYVQFRRVTTQGIEGVSAVTWLLFTLNGGFWISYGAWSAHSFVMWFSSFVCWPLQGIIVFRLAPWRRLRGSFQAIGLFVGACVVPGLVGGWAWSVYGCGVSMVVLRTPQIRQLLRSHDASGVSAASWYFSVGCAALWIAYYADVHLWAPLIATVCSGLGSLAIATLAVARHRQEDREVVRLEVFAPVG